MNLSSALVYSTQLRVSVYGTGYYIIRLAGFLGSLITTSIRLPVGARYCPVSASGVDLPAPNIPTRFNVLFRQYAGVSLLRRDITDIISNGILTVYPSNEPCGISLGPDLP